MRKETAQGYAKRKFQKKISWVGVNQFGLIGLFCRRELHERCAAASGECGSAGIKWSAVNGSFALLPSPHIQQLVAVSRTCLALRW